MTRKTFYVFFLILIFGATACNKTRENETQQIKSNKDKKMSEQKGKIDLEKKKELIEILSSQKPPQVISTDQFFCGNNDKGSIGCNLGKLHPGVRFFQKIFDELVDRDDVITVYVQVGEINPGDNNWPFSDTVYVIGHISDAELRQVLKELYPSEIGTAHSHEVPKMLPELHEDPIHVVWWD